jgi:hypothetical protein
MSLYREPGQARRRRRWIVAGVAGAVVVIAVAVILIAGSGGPPSRDEQVKAARAAAGQALDGLELVQIEYRQAVKNGQVVEPTEYGAARSDVQRARDALVKSREALQAIDPGALPRAERALDGVSAAVERRVASAELADAVAAARGAIEPLSR